MGSVLRAIVTGPLVAQGARFLYFEIDIGGFVGRMPEWRD